MAMRLDYLARETGQNLIRNWLLTIATVLIVAVSLSMLGITMLLGYYGIDNAFRIWNDDVSFIVYMQTSASDEQIDAIGRELDNSPQVESTDYYDADESYDLFVELFEDSDPDLIDVVGPEDLPTSYRVTPSNSDAGVVEQLADTFDGKPGVEKVDFPSEQVRQVQSAAERIRLLAISGVIVLLVASVVLIFIAIQTAVFSRRREIEVMRLVGATNWFIRIPFIVEGVLQGLAGALLSSGLVAIAGRLWTNSASEFDSGILADLVWEGSQGRTTYLLILGVGTIVGMVGSLLSVSWYLRD